MAKGTALPCPRPPNAYITSRPTRSIHTPTSLNPSAILSSAVNSSSGPNSLPRTTSIRLFGPVLLLLLRCSGVGLEGTSKLLWRGCTTMRTGSLRGVSRRSPCSLSGAHCDRASATSRLERPWEDAAWVLGYNHQA